MSILTITFAAGIPLLLAALAIIERWSQSRPADRPPDSSAAPPS